jgi:hypothetical protein
MLDPVLLVVDDELVNDPIAPDTPDTALVRPFPALLITAPTPVH